jgi:hypothetical protein
MVEDLQHFLLFHNEFYNFRKEEETEIISQPKTKKRMFNVKNSYICHIQTKKRRIYFQNFFLCGFIARSVPLVLIALPTPSLVIRKRFVFNQRQLHNGRFQKL